MTNTALMDANFERNKNIKATTYTILICALLFLVFFYVHWTMPQPPPPVGEIGMEVNLGNSETGSGEVSPHEAGNPDQSIAATSAPATASEATPPPAITGDPNETSDVTVNKTVPTPIPAKPIKPEVATKPAEKPNNSTTVAPPKPVAKAQMGKINGDGATGAGGDSFEGKPNQGNSSGNGNQGNSNGKAGSDSYNGNASSGNGGVMIRSGLKGRRINRYPNFEDDFNESAKIAVDITVDNTGTVTAANINPKGTTTPNKTMWNIALRKARELKLNAGTEEGESGTIVFNFKLRGE